MNNYGLVLEEIKKASHIAILVDTKLSACELGCASALYTYLLQEHKKVSLTLSDTNFPKRFEDIAWMEKRRDRLPLKVDYVLNVEILFNSELNSLTLGVWRFLEELTQKVNTKMAHSLYYALYSETQQFSCSSLQKEHFELAAKLMSYGVNTEQIKVKLSYSQALASLRLKSEVLKNFSLLNSATLAYIEIDSNMLEHCGAGEEDIKSALDELLRLSVVEVACADLKLGEESRRIIRCKNSSDDVKAVELEILEYIKGK